MFNVFTNAHWLAGITLGGGMKIGSSIFLTWKYSSFP
jgi:hypothetical protein